MTNDTHSNLGPSKIMQEDGSTLVVGGVARLAAAIAQVRERVEGKTLTLDGGDYSQGTPYQDGYQSGWEILSLGVEYTTLGNHEFDVGDQAIENSWVNAAANAQAFGVTAPLPRLVISNMFVKYDEAGAVIEYTPDSIVPDDITTNAFAAGEYLDVIQSAHSHTCYDAPLDVNGVMIYSTGCYAQTVGVLSLKRTDDGREYIADETGVELLTQAYDFAEGDSAPAKAYQMMSALVAQYDKALVAEDGYFSNAGPNGRNAGDRRHDGRKRL